MNPPPDTALAPADERPVVLFDGVCNLCNGAVQFLIARDPAMNLRFASLQSDAGRALLEAHDAVLPAGDPESIVVVADGKVYEHSDAVLRFTRELAAPWRWGAALRFFPRFLRDVVYRFVARNRYRWFGRQDQCLLPTPELRRRFLT